MKKILLWCAVVLMSMQIFGFSSKTAEESSDFSEKIAGSVVKTIVKVIDVEEEKTDDVFNVVHFLIRKGAHLTEFAVLSLLTFFLAHSYGFKNSVCAIISLTYCLIFAVTDEFHQLFVSGRSGEVRDVLVDFCGGIIANLGSALGFRIKKIRQKIK